MKMKIFGERNCGTRALQALLETNLGAECLPGTAPELDPPAYARSGDREAALDAIFRGTDEAHAWKHCATNFDEVGALGDCLTIFLVKHPLAWLASLFDRPYHQIGPRARSIAELTATPWQTVERERLEGRSFKPLDLYREKISSYLELAPRVGGVFVRFEDLIADPEMVMRRLGLSGSFVPHERSTKGDGKTLDDYRAYYGEERWRRRITDVVEEPDWGQLEMFGYR
jgi:hypothetical protein